MSSSEVHKRRVELLRPCVKMVVARGVAVQTILPDLEDAMPRKAQIIADTAGLLKQAGFQVSLCNVCSNLVVADSATFWYGSITSFAYTCFDNQVLRFTSGDVARKLEGLVQEDRCVFRKSARMGAEKLTIWFNGPTDARKCVGL
ncbi:hypothetical protein [Enteroscipio rubneri]|uniref:hypothetical protein n=1 Tax=Enteroscipio rubneri TaxID=2070686 RepID=UPI0032095B25